MAGTSCTFTVDLKVPSETVNGTYPNTTSEITAIINGETVSGDSASDDLQVLAGPVLVKEFSVEQVSPGDATTLTFTIKHTDDASSNDYTNINFTDDLDAFLSGLTVGTIVSPPCGDLSVNASNVLSFSNGSLTPGAGPCVFSVDLTLDQNTAGGIYTNTTSELSSDSGGLNVNSDAASAELQVSPLKLIKEFTNDPVLPGSLVDVEYTLFNNSQTLSLSNIGFNANFDDVISGATVVGPPQNDVCGTGSFAGPIGPTLF